MPAPPPPEYDDNPDWTAEDFARARPSSEVLPAAVVAAFTSRSISRALAGQGSHARLDQITTKENVR
jgi:hypothetical protein